MKCSNLTWGVVLLSVGLGMGCQEEIWYQDVDGDGFGDPYFSIESDTAPDGFVADGTDCDDSDPAVNPDTRWHQDIDGDGFGDPDVSEVVCEPPSGSVMDGTDCDDEDPAIDHLLWYQDIDGDGFGDPDVSEAVCEPPSGFVAYDTDCDDVSADIHPDAREVCDGVDNNCDGGIDDWEPNDTFSQAVYVLDNNQDGTIQSWSHDGSSDFWKMYAEDDWDGNNNFFDDFYVYAELTHVPEGTELGLYLYDGAGHLLDSDLSGGAGTHVYEGGSTGPDDSDYFYVEVEVLSGGTCQDFYDLYLANDY